MPHSPLWMMWRPIIYKNGPVLRELWDSIVRGKIIARGEANNYYYAEYNKIPYFTNKGTYLLYYMLNALFCLVPMLNILN